MEYIKYGDFIKKAAEFYDFSHEAFNWLFWKIYPDETYPYVNCVFEISPEEIKNDEGCRFYGMKGEGLIILYLYNIIADCLMKDRSDNIIKFNIISVITHELFHLNQYSYKYGEYVTTSNMDETYMNRFRYIEHPVVNQSIEFLYNNMADISKQFDIVYNMDDVIDYSTNDNCYMIRTDTYKQNSPELYWTSFIMHLLGKNIIYQDLLDLISNGKEGKLYVKYNSFRGFEDDYIYIKKDGIYYAPSKELLNHSSQMNEGINGDYEYLLYTNDDNSEFRVEIIYTLDMFKPIERIQPGD